MIRVGIIGSGGMGNVHARQYSKRSDVDVAFYDHNPGRAEGFRKSWGFEFLSGIDELIKRSDVVDVCLPTPAHHEIGLKVIAQGKALFMEKPVARTVKQAHELYQAAEKANVPFMPGQVVRFFPEYVQAQKAVASGKIGKPAAARASRGGGAPSGEGGWFMDHTKSGGVLLDLSIHDFDWLRWTLGEVKSLYSRTLGAATDMGPDHGLTTLTFDNGCVAHVEGTWMDPGGFRTTFELAGSGGLIQHDSRQNVPLQTTSTKTASEKSEGAPLPSYDGNLIELEDPYFLELDAFLTAVRTGSKPPVTGLDGLHAVSIAEAAIESSKTGKVVSPARAF